MRGQHYINNQWQNGLGEKLVSNDPSTGLILWEGNAANVEQIHSAINAAKNAFPLWANLSFAARYGYLKKFADIVTKKRKELTQIISKEMGKPLWEADLELNSVIHKVPIALEAYQERCKEKSRLLPNGTLVVRHKPHGIIAVLGPFNFPLHLPLGHIVPALLAGNTIVFKPSEFTPFVAEKLFECWEEAEMPAGVINLLQGGGVTGSELTKHPRLNGLLFTGSYRTGQAIAKQFSEQPEKILALEMGGNNPLVVHGVQNLKGAVYQTLQSAYLTSGQRCTCARRLIVTDDVAGHAFIEALILAIKAIQVGAYSDVPEPFMGPLVSSAAADRVVAAYDGLIKEGAKILVPLQRKDPKLSFLSPALLDVTRIKNRRDDEIVGPLLQLIWVKDFSAALQEANHTAYGLSAALLCEDKELYQRFLAEIQAGIINWNKPTTGANYQAPFGGIGHSGNHRPSAYYAADYCSYPTASLEETELKVPAEFSPGLQL